MRYLCKIIRSLVENQLRYAREIAGIRTAATMTEL